jgi:6-phosphogluconolactonase/glucosamine-6-phosphate isomerase/deaminase
MKYILTAGWDDGVADLTERLVRELAAGKRVLWLTSGGSNIPASVQIMDNISADLSRNLTVSLADERYGKPGHSESNWSQLMQGSFSGKQATLLPVLRAGASFEETIRDYNQLIEKALAANDVVVAQLGIGPDGHIAGILPGSPAAAERSTLVTGYQAPPLWRLTLTFPGLRRVTAAYAFAFGKPKQQALASLQSKSLELDKQPAQILKELPEAYMYSDQVGEHV